MDLTILIALPSAFLADIARTIRRRFPDAQIDTVATDQPRWHRHIGSETCAATTILLLGNAHLSQEELEYLPALRHVQRWGAGVDNLDLNQLSTRGISVGSVPSENSFSVAEHFWALTLAAARRVLDGNYALETGEWPQAEIAPKIRDINGATLGLVGMGTIGTRVAAIGKVFGASVIYARRTTPTPAPPGQRPLEEVLSSDIVGLVCDLNPSTRHLLDRNRLRRIQRGAIIVNVGRGDLVDEDALLERLESYDGPAIYAADVMSSEPFANLALMRHSKTLFSPHLAGRSPQALERVTRVALTMIEETALRFEDSRGIS